jgi:hypothetical protein
MAANVVNFIVMIGEQRESITVRVTIKADIGSAE